MSVKKADYLNFHLKKKTPFIIIQNNNLNNNQDLEEFAEKDVELTEQEKNSILPIHTAIQLKKFMQQFKK